MGRNNAFDRRPKEQTSPFETPRRVVGVNVDLAPKVTSSTPKRSSGSEENSGIYSLASFDFRISMSEDVLNDSNPSLDRAKREEALLRPKVERFFLKTTHTVAWDDIIGNETARTALVEAIEHPIRYKKLYAHYGKRPTKGVLLYGAPGCGKTMFGKAAASVLSALHGRKPCETTMLSIKGPEIQSPYVGVTEALIRDVFAYARAFKTINGFPLVIFIDEADAILPSRDGNGTGRRATHWEESNVATFLTEMDGLEDSGALVILATNRPNAIDAAILRDGRCDRKIKVERPDIVAGQAIIAKALHGVPAAADVTTLAHLTAEAFFSPANRLAIINHETGTNHVTLSDIVNGAMLVGLVEHAKGIAFRRDLASGGVPTGICVEDLGGAVAAVLRQNQGLMHGDATGEVIERLGVPIAGVELVKPGAEPVKVRQVLH